MTGRLAGKRSLIVGGGSGIGRAVIDAFVAEGAEVAVLELSPEKCSEVRAAHPDVVVIEGDATSMADNRDAVEAAVAAFGGLDTLIGCVGVFDFHTGLRALPPDRIEAAFDEAFAINVKSQLLSIQAALRHLSASKGSVTLTASTSSFYPQRGGLLYVASKFALRGVVLALAGELAPDMRVNAVAPGGTAGTDLRGLSTLGLGGRSLGSAPDRDADLRSRTPLQVALDGADHAAGYVFLASDEARGYTGTFLHSDGGMAVS